MIGAGEEAGSEGSLGQGWKVGWTGGLKST